MAAMYALAFVSDDIEYIVTEALKTLPARSTYRRCIEDVIATYRPRAPRLARGVAHVPPAMEKRHGMRRRRPAAVQHRRQTQRRIRCHRTAVRPRRLRPHHRHSDTLRSGLRLQPRIGGRASQYGHHGYEAHTGGARRSNGPRISISHIPTCRSPTSHDTNSSRHALDNIIRNGGRIDNDAVVRTQHPRAVRFEQSFRQSCNRSSVRPSAATFGRQPHNRGRVRGGIVIPRQYRLRRQELRGTHRGRG